jgi:hypothetical protein
MQATCSLYRHTQRYLRQRDERRCGTPTRRPWSKRVRRLTIFALSALALVGAGCGEAIGGGVSGEADCHEWLAASVREQITYTTSAISHLQGVQGGIYTTKPVRFADDISTVCRSPAWENEAVKRVAAQVVLVHPPGEHE